MHKETIVVLDNIRSAYNVGAIFRTAEGAGVTSLLLVGYTPAPLDRFGRKNTEIAKTSLGASAMVPYEAIATTQACTERLMALKEDGYQIIAVEQTSSSVSLYEIEYAPKTVFIFGNEIDGVQPALLEVASVVAEIPMRGQKESLNVSVSVGVVLFQKEIQS